MTFSRAEIRLSIAALTASVGIAACTTVPQFVTDTKDGGGGASAGAGSSSSSGAAAVCSTPSDCKGAEGECAHRTCVAERCGESLTPKGTAIGAQIDGDCRKTVCDGTGKSAVEADSTDVPDDHDPCTTDACSPNGPTNMDAPGASCGTDADGGAVVCDIKAHCECSSDAACGTSTECVSISCQVGSGSCVYTAAVEGQILKNGQTAGDCLVVACNGKGQTKTIPDDSDHPPDDGDPCTQETCETGTPAHPPIPGLNDGNVCTHDTCAKGGGSIMHASFPDGTPCGDCSTCVSGACKPGSCSP